MQPIAFYYPEGHQAHTHPIHEEKPERVEVMVDALKAAGLWQRGIQIEPQELIDSVLYKIHTREMVAAVKAASAKEAVLDADTFTTKASWQLALNAAGGAAAVAHAVWRGEAVEGFALTRPPGHHATPTQSMGFCLLNNVALAAESLIQQENAKRIAIVDMDVHHGNGTQDIFYERADVMFFSTHQHPLYPGTGMLGERGLGAGEGFTVNMPLPPSSGDGAFRVAHGEIVPALLDRFQPEMILVSLGLDSHWRDPLGNLRVSAAGYAEAISSLRNWARNNCGGRLALILEGGYDLEADAACAVAVTQTMLGEPIYDLIGPAPQKETHDWVPILDRVKQLWEIH